MLSQAMILVDLVILAAFFGLVALREGDGSGAPATPAEIRG